MGWLHSRYQLPDGTRAEVTDTMRCCGVTTVGLRDQQGRRWFEDAECLKASVAKGDTKKLTKREWEVTDHE